MTIPKPIEGSVGRRAESCLTIPAFEPLRSALTASPFHKANESAMDTGGIKRSFRTLGESDLRGLLLNRMSNERLYLQNTISRQLGNR